MGMYRNSCGESHTLTGCAVPARLLGFLAAEAEAGWIRPVLSSGHSLCIRWVEPLSTLRAAVPFGLRVTFHSGAVVCCYVAPDGLKLRGHRPSW